MAEGATVDLNTVVCRFFARLSYCKDGDQCPFSHDQRRLHYPRDNVCRFYLKGACAFGSMCFNRHVNVPINQDRSSECDLISSGHNDDVCELCDTSLHTYGRKKRHSHLEECKQAQLDELMCYAIQKSSKKTCGICLDVVLEKEPTKRQFGILENCSHTFCWNCILKWRNSDQNDPSDATIPDVTQACPECRIVSHRVRASSYFVDNVEEKRKLFSEEKISSNSQESLQMAFQRWSLWG